MADSTMITYEQLTQRFRYDPETGAFFILKFSRFVGHKNERGYVRILIDGTYYKAHRLAFLYMTGTWPKDQVDHINRNRSDNRWINLRDSSNWQNAQNRGNRKK